MLLADHCIPLRTQYQQFLALCDELDLPPSTSPEQIRNMILSHESANWPLILCDNFGNSVAACERLLSLICQRWQGINPNHHTTINGKLKFRSSGEQPNEQPNIRLRNGCAEERIAPDYFSDVVPQRPSGTYIFLQGQTAHLLHRIPFPERVSIFGQQYACDKYQNWPVFVTINEILFYILYSDLEMLLKMKENPETAKVLILGGLCVSYDYMEWEYTIGIQINKNCPDDLVIGSIPVTVATDNLELFPGKVVCRI